MKILAIETSCDDTSVSIVENGRKILALETFSQINIHKIYGGVVPEIASRCHVESISHLAKEAMLKSGLNFNSIDAVAVTYTPGLIGSLLVGVNFAKGICLATGKDLIPVHHLRSHIASNYVSNIDLKPPFLCLVVSGGHTSIVEVLDYTKMRIVGKTRDDAAGEVFDKAARAMGMDYPGGVLIDKLAEKGDPNFITLPQPEIKDCKYDFSFSGLKTSVVNKINSLKQKNSELPIEDICASFRKSVVNYLVKNFVSAATDLGYKNIAISGGVSANSLLRKNLELECKKRDWNLYRPEVKFCGDNAAMVGAQAYYEYLEVNITDLSLNAVSRKNI